jgi:nitronate monooxygenase
MSGENPLIIQGGMGAGVSDWRLAQAVSRQGHLGVVSGMAPMRS